MITEGHQSHTRTLHSRNAQWRTVALLLYSNGVRLKKHGNTTIHYKVCSFCEPLHTYAHFYLTDTHFCVCVCVSKHLMGQWAHHPPDFSSPLLTPSFNDGPSVTVPTGRVTGLFAGTAGCLWMIGQQIVRGDGHVTARISIWVKNLANVANSSCLRERERVSETSEYSSLKLNAKPNSKEIQSSHS